MCESFGTEKQAKLSDLTLNLTWNSLANLDKQNSQNLYHFPSATLSSCNYCYQVDFGGYNETTRLLEFFVKTFALFLTVTSIGYFVVWLSLTAPHTYNVYPIHVIIEMGMDFILPISFLLEAISIIIYGIYKAKLKAWEVFLSSWYVSVFVLVGYYVWWPYQQISSSEEIYPTHAGAMSDITQLFFILLLSVLVSVIYTLVYTKYKKPQIQKPT